MTVSDILAYTQVHSLVRDTVFHRVYRILPLYNPQAPTKISADASSYGLGAVLIHERQL